MSAPTDTRLLVFEAIRHARHGTREGFLNAMAELDTPPRDTSFDEHGWLEAERDYRNADYRESLRGFEAWLGQTGRSRLPWMTYLAHQRSSYAAWRLGRISPARTHLGLAEDLLQAQLPKHPDMRLFRADLEAMHGHLLEVEGSLELVAARFMQAHQMALACGHTSRAATTASDIGRVKALLGRLTMALEWQRRAREHLAHRSDLFILRSIRLRVAKVQRAMRHDPAEVRRKLMALREECKRDRKGAHEHCLTPDVLIGVEVALHELELIRQPGVQESPTPAAIGEARKLLLSARHTAANRGMELAMLDLDRDESRLDRLAGDTPSDLADARNHFCSALRRALDTIPTAGGTQPLDLQAIPRLTLLSLADDIEHHHDLITLKHLPADYLDKLAILKKDLEKLFRPRLHGQEERIQQRDVAAHKLVDHLLAAVETPYELITTTVYVRDAHVRLEHELEQTKLEPFAVKLLKILLAEPARSLRQKELGEALEISGQIGFDNRIRVAFSKLREELGAAAVDSDEVDPNSKRKAGRLYRVRFREKPERATTAGGPESRTADATPPLPADA